ncbi:MAG: AmmeMemoRadiSam system protein B [Candidatus Riflebacteria bacterium]|nr:AmmeMemoRadiSam system protein B [Candidatus Riflebacteria bacterium]
MKREPVVSGQFYPDLPQEINETIESCYIHPVGVGKNTVQVKGKLKGLILPHAGHIYSGPTTTWGMKRLSLENPKPKRFLMLGPNHRVRGESAAISPDNFWETPLGECAIDEELRQAFLNTGSFKADTLAHSLEHSIEVQIPFLQHLYKKETFSILPIAFLHTISLKDCEKIGKAISQVLSRSEFSDVCVIVSSDFSHDITKNEAYKIDGEAIEIIEKIDPSKFYEMVKNEDRSICGFIPITIFLFSLLGKNVAGRKLNYSTSMEIIPHPRGVGYGAIAFEEKH